MTRQEAINELTSEIAHLEAKLDGLSASMAMMSHDYQEADLHLDFLKKKLKGLDKGPR